jgi:serine/threonine-protein kinase
MSQSGPTNYKIGSFEVVRHIAQGSDAAIYEVVCPQTGQHRAMKLSSRPEIHLERLQRTFEALDRLSHPNIIQVHSMATTDDGRPFLILDLVDGVPAQVHAKSLGPAGTPARTEAVITIGIQLAEALDYLHAHDMVHRDIKSANVLVEPDGRTQLIDFGSALLPGTSQPPKADFIGTYTYAPPEQIKGHPVSPESDIYAMGVLLYRLLSGVRPFQADTAAELARMHLEAQPVPLCDRLTDLPAHIGALVSRMMAKQRADRPRRASEVATALRGGGQAG